VGARPPRRARRAAPTPIRPSRPQTEAVAAATDQLDELTGAWRGEVVCARRRAARRPPRPSTPPSLPPLPSPVGDELNLAGLKKKKKSKSKADRAPGDAGADDDAALFAPLDPAKRKKRRHGPPRQDDDFGDAAAADGAGAGPGSAAAAGAAWTGTDRDYAYAELLDRVFGILRANNPELTGEKRRTLLKPPQVAREGTKKTVFTNFADLCRAMNRPTEHVQAFLLAELGTSGNTDAQARLIVKGRFLPKAFEGVLRRYVNEYVLCSSCKSADSLLDRDSSTRVTSLRCQQCGASRTVAAIKAGFVARTTRRPKVG